MILELISCVLSILIIENVHLLFFFQAKKKATFPLFQLNFYCFYFI